MLALSAAPIFFVFISLSTSAAVLPRALGVGPRWQTRRPGLEGAESSTSKEVGRHVLRIDWGVPAGAARLSDSKVTDQKYLAGVVLRERKEQKLDRETLRERAELERRRLARSQREREAGRARRTLQTRLKKKRQVY